MKLLFTLDEKNYSEDMPVLERFAVRAIVCRDGKFLMQQSAQGDYKIPGGGMDVGERQEQTLLREVREETGHLVIPESINGVGEILEKRIDCFNDRQIYIAHSYFYTCQVEEESVELSMTESEIRLGYHPVWAPLDTIISVNSSYLDDYWQKRDFQFLKWYRDLLKNK